MWSGLAVVALVLTLASFAATVLAVVTLWRLRRDSRVIEAAERFELVDLTTVVKRYVPSEDQTFRSAEEMAIARQVISARRPHWRRLAVVFGIALACCVAMASYSGQRQLQMMAAARLVAKPLVNLDVLKDVQGVWGWRADFLESCPENPQTITVAPDRKTLSLRYAKPYRQGEKTITNLDFNVLSAKPDRLVLSLSDASRATNLPPTQVVIQFIDANTFSISRDESPLASSGTIVRCPPVKSAEGAAAH
jgi:hypothetical protein